MDKRYARILAPLLLALLAAGCATSQVSGPAKTTAAAADAAFAQAAELARSSAALSGDARAANVRRIQQLLAGIDNATLAKEAAELPIGDPLYPYAGKALQDRGLPLPRPFDRANGWNFATRPPAERDGYRPPVKLAVLLPLSGPLAAVSAPVRDGLLTGYYGETRRRPEIEFFDTAGTPGGAVAAYGRAATSGADFVLGPLGRDEVSALFGETRLSVPVLALNRGTVVPPAGAAGFSLAPEDDGQGAAEYLLQRERRKALVIGGSDDSGIRAARAFRERFIERGGEVVASLSAGDVPGDLGAALGSAAAQGVDAVFLAVKGSTARALTPQLALAGLGGKSRVATSQLATGTGKPEEDAALDGIVYPTETWTARGIASLPSADSVGANLPTARGGAARLFAFGYDAWQLTGYLEKLALGANAQLRGATGTLSLDGFGNVQRTPAWATFSGGRSMPIIEGSAADGG